MLFRTWLRPTIRRHPNLRCGSSSTLTRCLRREESREAEDRRPSDRRPEPRPEEHSSAPRLPLCEPFSTAVVLSVPTSSFLFSLNALNALLDRVHLIEHRLAHHVVPQQLVKNLLPSKLTGCVENSIEHDADRRDRNRDDSSCRYASLVRDDLQASRGESATDRETILLMVSVLLL